MNHLALFAASHSAAQKTGMKFLTKHTVNTLATISPEVLLKYNIESKEAKREASRKATSDIAFDPESVKISTFPRLASFQAWRRARMILNANEPGIIFLENSAPPQTLTAQTGLKMMRMKHH